MVVNTVTHKKEFSLKKYGLLLLVIFLTYPFYYSFAKKNEDTTYFQQEVNYELKVTLDDKKHQLDAHATIEYTNNSPDNIHYIYFHLWPNAYKNYKTALSKQKLEEGNTKLYYADDKHLGFIDGLEFKVNDEVVEWSYDPKHEDICIVYLPKPLHTGKSITITTPFSVKLPTGIFSRLGHIDQSYQITQWYPKPAVYDKNGWNPMPYLDQGEFYSEYGSFDVFITLPKNYVVGATGDLIDGNDELNWLNEKAIKTQQIDSFTSLDMSFPVSNDSLKTLHYYQEKVHDFAWFADKRYHVLKGEVELPHSKRKVTTWAMFTNNEAELWKKSIEYLNDAIYYYSLWNGDYPYKQVTAVDGALSAGGGMEYPNVTIIGESGSDFGLETVIMHEVGHNWFYGILGTNERNYPWMDEGINSMNENRYIETKYPYKGLLSDSINQKKTTLSIFDLSQYKHKAYYELMYLINARKNLDQPIDETASEFTPLNYGGIVYAKTALVFDYLMAYLGEEVFDKCMQRYFNEWKFKHPQFRDLRIIFEEETGKDLDWFFVDLIQTTGKIDYSITRSKKDTSNSDSILLKIKNRGDIYSPFSISGIKDSKIVTSQWYEPIHNKEFVPFLKGDFDSYKIDAQMDIPEIKRNNNTLRKKGLFKTFEPLRLQWLSSIDNPDKTQLFYTPVLGWNNNDKLMAGMVFHNIKIPFSRRFEYVIAPLYGFGSKNPTGYITSYYHITPNNIFQDISIGGMLSSFSYLSFNKANSSDNQALAYYKLAPKISFQFKKKRARQFTSIFTDYEYNRIFEEQAIFSQNPNEIGQFTISTTDFYVNNLTVGIKSKHPINPFSVTANFQHHKDFLKLNLIANYRFSYKKKGTGLDIRFFVGRFLSNDNEIANSRFNFNLSGGESSDYLYNEFFLGRNATEGIVNRQFSIADGGFKNLVIPESEGKFVLANRWLNAVNIKSNVLINLISIYADFGIVGSVGRDAINNEIDEVSDVAYNFGASLNVIPNIFEIYFPFNSSSDLNQLNYGEKIRFILDINLIKSQKTIRNLDL